MEAGNAVQRETIPVVGRPFWVFRGSPGDESWASRFNTAFDDLQRSFHHDGAGPLGLATLTDDPEILARRSEAVWKDTDLLFAGYTADGRQVRIRYFWGAKIGPGVPGSPSVEQQRDVDYSLEDRYRIEPLSGSAAVTRDDVLALWEREGVVPTGQAQGRVQQVRLVAITTEGELAGVSTLFLERSRQLRLDMWNYRTFVAEPHRMSNIAAQLIIRNRDELESAFTSGQDVRGRGVLFDLQNEGLKRHLNNAYWPPSDFTFIGDNPRGDHRRVHYFPGARVPVPLADTGYH